MSGTEEPDDYRQADPGNEVASVCEQLTAQRPILHH
jgi:hypothetical protein